MIVITGASGLLGSAVMDIFDSNETIGIGFSRAAHPILKLNLLDDEEVDKFFNIHKPAIVIHCAAERRPDVAAKNEEQTRKLNIGVCRHLANLRYLLVVI
jgi:dTDP-4-dehydrorhamnose reductase